MSATQSLFRRKLGEVEENALQIISSLPPPALLSQHTSQRLCWEETPIHAPELHLTSGMESEVSIEEESHIDKITLENAFGKCCMGIAPLYSQEFLQH